MIKILVTGCAGFIGFHLAKSLSECGKYEVIGIDNLNNYYDVKLKKERLSILAKYKNNFSFYKIDITNKKKLNNLYKSKKFKYVIHLAAQAGVRHSISNPETYVENNINGFFNIMDISRIFRVKHFIYASTSSVYGSSNKFPLKESFSTDMPNSFYAASKKTNEVLAYSYSYIYQLPTTGLRFFTVYGPLGRPDMALHQFADSIYNSKSVKLFNRGNHTRDFTHVDDIVKGIKLLIFKPPVKKVPYDIFNIGSSKPSKLKLFLKLIEKNLGIKSKIKLEKFQLGDVHKTHASIAKLKKRTGYNPHIKIQKGIKDYVDWYLSTLKK